MADQTPLNAAQTNQTLRRDPWMMRHVLTFDGGGVRGYFSLLCVRRLMEYVESVERRKHTEEYPGERACDVNSFHPCKKPENVSYLDRYTEFLPCHYFDCIAGTSTGGLIAIMLGRFRMTVDDCIHEYKHLAGEVFGRPRRLHIMNTFGLVGSYKYDANGFENVIKDVIERRVENDRHNPRDARFEIEIGLCRVFIIANVNESDGMVTTHRFFRSYESTQASSGRPGDICVWQVARATTAAPLYFEPLELQTNDSMQRTRTDAPTHRASEIRSNATDPRIERLEDGGFGPANNPSMEMFNELRKILPRNMRIGTFVSIGTARTRVELRGPRLLRFVRGTMHRVGDPEPTHRHMVDEAKRNHPSISYHRINEPEGLEGVQMDDWKPKATGDDTIRKMEAAFNLYSSKIDVVEIFQQCAEELVEARRARVRTNRPKWDRFALGRYFRCVVSDCPDETQLESDEVKFRAHLREGHGLSDGKINAELRNCERQWEYRARP
ncbi:FabD/lysophospholipase-like protein [Annulohypoxylon bovei var. microspora]|nr:FabD/lysophospholipase-like protein [Annulohypoxylon bovei var. microspora]